jgi:hypothetical protein
VGPTTTSPGGRASSPSGSSTRRSAAELECQTLIAESESQILVVYTATPGTESAERLRLLGVVGGQEFADAPAWDLLSST